MSPPCDAVAVVVVDDDESFREGLAANLADDGHVVRAFADPSEVPHAALAAAGVVITDYQMGAIDGLTFADGVHARHPAAAIVVATAYWTVEMEAEVAARPFVSLCRKPLDYDEIHAHVHRLVGGA